MIFTKYRLSDGQITGVLTMNTEDEAARSCGPEESYVVGYGDMATQEVVSGEIVRKPEHVIEENELALAWRDLRTTRAYLLARCDWTQVSDAPVDHAAWAVYRQALRDLPANTVDPRHPVWPVPPS